MSSKIHTGRFQIPAGGGGTQGVTGVGFTPKGILFRATTNTSEIFGGASDQTTPPALYYQAIMQDSAIGTNWEGVDACVYGPSFAKVRVDSMDGDGFTVSFDADVAARDIVFVAHD